MRPMGVMGHIREVTKNNIPILLVFLFVSCVATMDEYSNIHPLSRLEYEQKSYVILGIVIIFWFFSEYCQYRHCQLILLV